jgi:hypothetical protein
LVSEPAARSYLAVGGWWAELVLETFGFLEDLSYQLTEVHFHQEGHFVRYDGPKCKI